MRIPMSGLDRYTKNNLSFLRSKIRELHLVHRVSLQALLEHLCVVAAHSANNGMTVKVLSFQFCEYILGHDAAFTGDIDLKACCLDFL